MQMYLGNAHLMLSFTSPVLGISRDYNNQFRLGVSTSLQSADVPSRTCGANLTAGHASSILDFAQVKKQPLMRSLPRVVQSRPRDDHRILKSLLVLQSDMSRK